MLKRGVKNWLLLERAPLGVTLASPRSNFADLGVCSFKGKVNSVWGGSALWHECWAGINERCDKEAVVGRGGSHMSETCTHSVSRLLAVAL